MGLFSTTFEIKGRNKKYSYTADDLLEILESNSQSDYRYWIAPASELVNVCKEEGFPEKHAERIQTLILELFTRILRRGNSGGDLPIIDPKDKEAVQFCFDSLQKAEKSNNSRKNFLAEIIRYSTAKGYEITSILTYGAACNAIRERWIAKKIDEYFKKPKINIDEIIEILTEDFNAVTQSPEWQAALEQDAKIRRKSQLEKYQSWLKALKKAGIEEERRHGEI